jgi:hypothetical protein
MTEGSAVRQEAAAGRPAVRLPGADEELTASIEERLAEFERAHEPSVLRDGPGWVPRVRALDYAVAILVNAAVVVWLVVALVGR